MVSITVNKNRQSENDILKTDVKCRCARMILLSIAKVLPYIPHEIFFKTRVKAFRTGPNQPATDFMLQNQRLLEGNCLPIVRNLKLYYQALGSVK